MGTFWPCSCLTKGVVHVSSLISQVLMLGASAHPKPKLLENINQVEWKNCARFDNSRPDLWSR